MPPLHHHRPIIIVCLSFPTPTIGIKYVQIQHVSTTTAVLYVCVCVLDVPAGVTQEEGHTGFFIHLPSAVRALIFLARRIQPLLSLVDRGVEFCVLTI